MNGKPGRLGVTVDGQPLPDEEARAFWGRFSDHMDANRGDLRGFAEKEGLSAVHPTMQGDRPVLVGSRSGSQKPYTNAPTVKPTGGTPAGPRPAGTRPAGTKPPEGGKPAGGAGPLEGARGASSGSPGSQGQPPRGATRGPARGGPPKGGRK